jgi:hypothetical protein
VVATDGNFRQLYKNWELLQKQQFWADWRELCSLFLYW